MSLGKDHGFTLIEILVAMSLLAIIGVLGYRGVDGARQSAERVNRTAERWQEISLVTERIGREVRQAVAIVGHPQAGQESPSFIGRRQPDSADMVFTRLTGDGNLRRVGYRWHGSASGELELLVWSSFDADTPTQHYSLLQGVAVLEFAYLDKFGSWHAEWPSASRRALPRALRIRMTLSDGGLVERIFDVPAAE